MFLSHIWGLKGNVRTPSIARWKARGRLSIRRNRTFSLSYGWEVINGTLSMSTCFEGAGHFGRKFQTEGRHPPTTVGVRKVEWLPFRVVSKYPQCIVWFVKKHACDRRTDILTDRQNYDRYNTVLA